MIEIDPTSPVPLYLQIADQMRRLIAMGALQPGDKAPTVRELARSADLPNAETPESRDICFVDDGDIGRFLAERVQRDGATLTPGPIRDRSGNVIGEHKGIRGLRTGDRSPLFDVPHQPSRSSLAERFATRCRGVRNSLTVSFRRRSAARSL